MIIKATGIIEVSPKNLTRKHELQSSWKNVVLIKTKCDIDRYYAWFLKKRFNLDLDKNIRGTHITFINDRMTKEQLENVKFFNGKEINFYYEIEPRSSGQHWWLRVYCEEAFMIRESLGLRREPFFSLHLTIGHANPKNLYHSEYILRMCKKFELISNSPRLNSNDLNI